MRKREEKAAIKRALNHDFVLPMHDFPARVGGGRVVARLKHEVPGPEWPVGRWRVAERGLGLDSPLHRLEVAPLKGSDGASLVAVAIDEQGRERTWGKVNLNRRTSLGPSGTIEAIVRLIRSEKWRELHWAARPDRCRCEPRS